MKTRRTLTNISFNSPDYFADRMNDLLRDGVIDWAYWIVHHADNDDKKQHIHFVFQPARSVETSIITSYFLEFPFYGRIRLPLKPTSKYVPCVSLDDWLLYCKHDKDYLISKGLERNYHYQWEDFCTTDRDSLLHDIGNINYNKIGQLSMLRAGVLNKIPFAELIQQGKIPIAYRSQYEAQYRALMNLECWEKRKLKEYVKADQIEGF